MIPSPSLIGLPIHQKMCFAANFGVSDSYTEETAIYVSKQSARPYCSGKDHKSKLLAQKSLRTSGGTVRIVDSTNFPISTAIAAILVEIEPGGMRELHWHPNNDEWQYYLSGKGQMTAFAANGTAYF